MSDKEIFLRYKKSIITVIALVLLCFFFKNSLPFIMIAILIGLSPLILFYGLAHPYFFILIFYSFSIFRLHEAIPGLFPFKIPLISAILSILSLTINFLLGRTTLYWRKEMNYFLVFFIFITLGVPLSYSFGTSYDYWSQIFLKIAIMFFMIIWTINNKKSFVLIIFLTISCGVFISIITIYNKVNVINLVEGTRASIAGNMNSSIGDPNDLALTLLFPFSFCFSLLLTKTRSFFLRLLGLFSSIIIVSAIIATQSRGGLLGLAGVIGYFFTHRFKSKALLIIAGSCAAIILFITANISMRQSGGGEGLGSDESSMGRIYAWKAAVNMAIHHPIWGVGLDGFQDSLFQYAVVWERVNRAVHSSWFGVLAEGGVVGLILFITCVYQALKLARRNINIIESIPNNKFTVELILARSLYAGLIGFCISSTFLTQGFTWPFYVFFALSISLSHYIEIKR